MAGVVLGCSGFLSAQGASGADQAKVVKILSDAYDAVRHNYYDQTFHGVDLDARYRDYTDKAKAAPSLNAGLVTVADFLNGLHDSHTYFAPPARPYKFDYGYRLAAVGDRVFVMRVRPETDAVGKVKAGDQVLAINGQTVTRENLHAAEYALNVLEPQPATKLLVLAPTGDRREVLVQTKVVPGRPLLGTADISGDIADLIREQEATDVIYRQKIVEDGPVMIWKMPIFGIEASEVDKIFSIARRHTTLIIDLRGNPGGRIDTLTRITANLFDHDVTIADQVMRKGQQKLIAKGRGANAYTGALILLVDGASASSSELLARVVQLEHRGKVIGDRSSGDVMATRFYPYYQMGGTVFFYQFAVTAANLLMTDGKSLEGTGVTPEDAMLPTAADIAAGRDPVMAHAAELSGLPMTPVAAGLLFPMEWTPFR